MKKLFKILIPIIAFIALFIGLKSYAVSPCSVTMGCTGISTLTGIPYGTGVNPLSTVTIGSGLSFVGGTLSSVVSSFPSAGIALSTGSGWAASITNNSSNWNLAYSHKTTEDAINGLVSVNGAGVYSSKVIGSDVQAYNTKLNSIANLANSTGWLKNDGSGAFSYTTPTYSDVGAQQSSTKLSSLAGLSYSSPSFVKMTGADTFSLDTNTYLTTSSASSTYVPYTGASSNLNLGANSLTATGITISGITGQAQCLQIDTNGIISGTGDDCGGSGVSLLIGSTLIDSGTNGYILYNNNGVLGNIATTGSGNVVLSTSPSLTTPSLGVATATSINGVTLSSLATGYSISGGTSSKTLTLDTNITASTLIVNPMTTQGDIIYGGASGVPTRLAKGSTPGSILTMNASDTTPEWGVPSVFTPNTPAGYNTMFYYVDGFRTDLKVSIEQISGPDVSLVVYKRGVNNFIQSRRTKLDLSNLNNDGAGGVIVGDYIYILTKLSASPYTVNILRYNANNLSAGATIITSSGQSIIGSSTITPYMGYDGTYFYFSYKAGNSATGGIISRYSLSGTTLTYIGDTTLSGVTSMSNLWIKSDMTFYIVNSGNLEKYNSSGVFQSSYSFAANITGSAINIKNNLYSRISDGSDYTRIYTLLLEM